MNYSVIYNFHILPRFSKFWEAYEALGENRKCGGHTLDSDTQIFKSQDLPSLSC